MITVSLRQSFCIISPRAFAVSLLDGNTAYASSQSFSVGNCTLRTGQKFPNNSGLLQSCIVSSLAAKLPTPLLSRPVHLHEFSVLLAAVSKCRSRHRLRRISSLWLLLSNFPVAIGGAKPDECMTTPLNGSLAGEWVTSQWALQLDQPSIYEPEVSELS